MSVVKSRRVNPVSPGKNTFNQLDEAGSLLEKHRVVPSRENLDHAHHRSHKPKARRGQLIDILV